MTNQDIKPFSLEWWLEQLYHITITLEYYREWGYAGPYDYYLELYEWTKSRIIAKYEQE